MAKIIEDNQDSEFVSYDEYYLTIDTIKKMGKNFELENEIKFSTFYIYKELQKEKIGDGFYDTILSFTEFTLHKTEGEFIINKEIILDIISIEKYNCIHLFKDGIANQIKDNYKIENISKILIDEIYCIEKFIHKVFSNLLWHIQPLLNRLVMPEINIKKNVQINSIDYLGQTKRDLAYIFWQLENLKLIENKTLGLTLSNIFTYNGEPIDNTYFNAEFGKFNKGERPTNAIELDKILLKPKKIITKL